MPPRKSVLGRKREELVDPYDMAHYDFHERFDEACELSSLSKAALDRLHTVFEATVGHAVGNKTVDWETDEELREFALDRVQEIAQLAKTGMCGGEVSEPVLTMAAEKVIYYWQPRCEKLFPGRLVFCEGYYPEEDP